MAERTEISFEVDPAETRVLDGYCSAKNIKRTQVMRKILKEWSEDKHREAMMVCNVAGHQPDVTGGNRDD